MNENFDLRPLLAKIDPASCTYDEWLNVGMALKHEGYPMDVWEAWSAYDAARFKDGECAQKWAGFNGSTTPVTGDHYPDGQGKGMAAPTDAGR